MALRKNTTEATPAPAFEAEEDDVTTVAATSAPAAEVVEAKVTAPAAEAPRATTTAVAAAPKPAVAVALAGKGCMVKSLQDALPAESLESMGYGVFPRITVDSAGGFVTNKNEVEHGKEIKVELMSWNYLWMVVTGEKNNSEANKLIRSSRDGVNLDGGQGLITDYIKQLKTDGYDKANVKQYAEIWGQLVWTKEAGEIPVDEQEMVQISVSPQSVGQFGRYLLETQIAVAKGMADSNVIHITGEKKTIGPNTFGIMKFKVAK